MHFTCGDHPHDSFGTKAGHFGPSGDLFRGQKADFGTIGGPKGVCFGHLGPPRRAPMGQIWVSHAYPVNIGHFDHYVVFGTKSNAVHTSRGAKSALEG